MNRLIARSHWSSILAVTAFSIVAEYAWSAPCDFTQVPYCTWAGSSFGFAVPGDTGAIINFETLPDGTGSYGGAAITLTFNYSLQGAMFTSPYPGLKVVGNSQLGYSLEAYTPSLHAHNWIEAALTQPERGIGVTTIGNATLFAYDSAGALITSVSYNQPSGVFFLGIKSVVPIAHVVVDQHNNYSSLDDFIMIHVPVPEPSTCGLLLLAAGAVVTRRRRRGH